MKKSTKTKIELIIVLSLIPILASLIIFHDFVLTGLSLAVYANMIPYNVVFVPSVNLNEYDGGVILNCLHGGGCPAGVSYVNDQTGEVEQREIVPMKSTRTPDTPSIVPDSVKETVAVADMFVYLIYCFIIAILIIVLIILLIKRRSRLKAK